MEAAQVEGERGDALDGYDCCLWEAEGLGEFREGGSCVA